MKKSIISDFSSNFGLTTSLNIAGSARATALATESAILSPLLGGGLGGAVSLGSEGLVVGAEVGWVVVVVGKIKGEKRVLGVGKSALRFATAYFLGGGVGRRGGRLTGVEGGRMIEKEQISFNSRTRVGDGGGTGSGTGESEGGGET